MEFNGGDALRFGPWGAAKEKFTFPDTVDAADAPGIDLQSDQGWTTVLNPSQEDPVRPAIQGADGGASLLAVDRGSWGQVDTLASARSGERILAIHER